MHTSDQGEYKFEDPFYIRYELTDHLCLVFHILNGKLIKIGALNNYKGKLLCNIHIGMNIKDAMEIEPRLYYDELEEQYFIHDMYEVTLETETPYLTPEENPDQKIVAITVYIPELSDFVEEYQRGNW